jgi:hypothetical protein
MAQKGRFKVTPLAEVIWEGENNAWHYLARLFDLGTPRRFAAVASQPPVGLCPDGGRGSRPPHRCRSCASRPNLDLAR